MNRAVFLLQVCRLPGGHWATPRRVLCWGSPDLITWACDRCPVSSAGCTWRTSCTAGHLAACIQHTGCMHTVVSCCCWHAVLVLQFVPVLPLGPPQHTTNHQVPLQSALYLLVWCRSVSDCKEHSFCAMECMLLCNMCHLVMKEVEKRSPGDQRMFVASGSALQLPASARVASTQRWVHNSHQEVMLSPPLHGTRLQKGVCLGSGGLCVQHQAALTAPWREETQ